MRLTVVLFPLVASVLFTFVAGKTFPPEELGMNRILWILLVFALANVLLYVLSRVGQRLVPLTALLQLSLVFPDQAPSRSRAVLRSSNSKKMLREIERAQIRGDGSDAALHSAYLVQLLRDLNEHDRLTRGHSERVRSYAALIGEEMGITGDDANLLAWGALLHDVGKLGVSAEILSKNGTPSADEWEELKTHPAAAATYLAPLRGWLGEWSKAADEHHCRFDGNGYPTNRGGVEISLAGRIVAVADAYDVMTSTRSYKKAMSAEVARRELTACAGTQFDPRVVAAMLRVGIGDLRAITGPWGWLANLTGSAQIPGRLAGLSSHAAAAAVMAVSSVAMAAPAVTPADGPFAFSTDPPVVVAAPEEGSSGPTTITPTSTSVAEQSTTTAAPTTTETTTTSTPGSTTTTTTTATTTTATPSTTTTAAPTTTAPTTTSTPPTTTTTTTIVNQPPSASMVRLGVGHAPNVRTITHAELLTGVSDPDDTSLSITALSVQSGGGVVSPASPDSYSYAPASGTVTELVTFNYSVSDGTSTADGTAVMHVVPQNDRIATIPRSAAPTIGGGIDSVWNNATPMPITHSTIGTSNNTARWRALWDDSNLYVLVEVEDTDLHLDSTRIWRDDDIEFYLDGDLSQGATNGGYDGVDDYQLHHRILDSTWEAGTRSLPVPSGTVVASAIVPDDGGPMTGYWMETSIPWAAIGITPTENLAFGIEAHVNDDDDGGGRDSKLGWNGDVDSAYLNPEWFGAAVLVG